VARSASPSQPSGFHSPSTIAMGCMPRSSTTCDAFVGLTWQKRLALGAATGKPACSDAHRSDASAVSGVSDAEAALWTVREDGGHNYQTRTSRINSDVPQRTNTMHGHMGTWTRA
jgi:hypothetical protein